MSEDGIEVGLNELFKDLPREAPQDAPDAPGADEEPEEDEDLPEVFVDTREPQARSLKRLGLNAHEELLGEDRSAREDRITPGGTEE